MGKNRRKTPDGYEESFTYEEMSAFVRKWDNNHQKSKAQFVLLRVLTPASIAYLIIIGVIIPFIASGFSFSYLNNGMALMQLLFAFVIACACAYYVGNRIWIQNEEKFRLFESVLNRYGAAWDWIEEEREKSREAERLRREKLSERNRNNRKK